LLAYGQWFSPGTPASSTTKTRHHDIAEILLKVALNTINQSINRFFGGVCGAHFFYAVLFCVLFSEFRVLMSVTISA
jgi:hypothetical protein